MERSIRYLRENFFAGQTFHDIEDLNAQAREWCQGLSQECPWRPGDSKRVGDTLSEESATLLRLPDEPFVSRERLKARVGKTPFVRFDSNDYSVSPEWVGHMLDIAASEAEVCIFHEVEEVARHGRSFGKYRTIENPPHTAEIWRQKKASERHAGLARLTAAVPQSAKIVEEIANRGENIGGAVVSLL